MLRKIFILGMVVVCLCGCDIRRIRTERGIKEYETDFSEVKAEVIQFTGMNNTDFENSINDEIEQAVESDLVAFDSQATENCDNVRMGNKCVLNISWDEKYNANDFISVVEEK